MELNTINRNLILCKFFLKKIAYLIQDGVSPHSGDKRRARRCTRCSVPDSFLMTSQCCNVNKFATRGDTVSHNRRGLIQRQYNGYVWRQLYTHTNDPFSDCLFTSSFMKDINYILNTNVKWIVSHNHTKTLGKRGN